MNWTLWQYRDDTPADVLVRHHRLAAALVRLTLFFAAMMFIGMLEMVVSPPGIWRTAFTYVAAGAVFPAVLLLIPSIIALAWMKETAAVCDDRGIHDWRVERPDRLAAKAGLKTIVYTLAIFGLLELIRWFPHWRLPIAIVTPIATVALLVLSRRRKHVIELPEIECMTDLDRPRPSRNR